MPTRSPAWSTDRRTDALVTLRAARIIVFGIVVLDSTDVVVAASQAGQSASAAVGDVLQDAVGLIAAWALLWARRTTAIVAIVVLAVLGLWRQRLVGIELDVLVIAVAIGIALAGRRAVVAVLALSGLGVLLIWYEDGQASGGVVAATLAGMGVLVGLGLRFVLAAQRTADEWVEREAEARTRVRAQLAADLRLVVSTHLSDTEAALRSLGPEAGVPELRRVLDVSADDSRVALNSLRKLLCVLDVMIHAEGREPLPAPSDDVPWTHRLPLYLRSPHVRVAANVTAGLFAIRHVAVSYPEMLSAGTGVAVWAAVGIAVWRPRAAAVVAGVAVALAATSSATFIAGCLGVALLWLLTGVSRSAVAATLAAGGTIVTLAAGLLRPGGGALEVVVTVVAATGGGLAGLGLDHYYRLVDDAAERRRTRQRERADHQIKERRWVARELHDLVGHQLSRVALHALAVDGVDDETELRGAIEGIAATVASSHRALASLLGAMAHSVPEAAPAGPLVPPTEAVAAMAQELRGAGHPVDVRLDPAVDSVDKTVQRTLERVLQEATTNMLRHAPHGAGCEVAVGLSGDMVQMRCANPVGLGKLDHSLGRGLRGMEERAAWLGGSVRAGTEHRGGPWVLRVELPTRADIREPTSHLAATGSGEGDDRR